MRLFHRGVGSAESARYGVKQRAQNELKSSFGMSPIARAYAAVHLPGPEQYASRISCIRYELPYLPSRWVLSYWGVQNSCPNPPGGTVPLSSPARKLSFTALFAACVTALGALLGAGPASAASYTLLTFPDNGQTAVHTFINSASSSIHMWMYELNDSTAEADLVARAKAGVSVKVILDGKHTSYNGAAYTYLTNNGVSVVYSSSSYYYTHEKSIVVDSSKILILSENLTSEYYSADRNFGVIDTDSSDVSAAETVFAADYAKTSVTPGDGDNLVWSPTDSTTRLLAVINGATKTLDVYALEFSSTSVVNALVARAKAGVTVRVVGEYSSSYTSNYSKLTSAGGSVHYYTSSDSLYIHAKGVVADLGTGSVKVFTGSQNWSSTSLSSNRELGLIITDSTVASGLDSAFVSDYNGGTPY